MTDAPEWIYLNQNRHGFWTNAAADMDAWRYTRTDLAEAAERAAYLRGLEDAAQVADDFCEAGCCDDDIPNAIRALAKDGGK